MQINAANDTRNIQKPGSPILEAVGVTQAFGAYVAVHPLDLAIQAGEFVTLLGPSGCGKTTLLRMVGGFGVPTAGRILSNGIDVTRLRPEKRPFNMVFQSYALFPHLNVFENVAYGLRASGQDEATIRRKVDDALELVGLQQRRELPVGSLSGGMSQRVALVRAIVNEPHVLLLDEPLAALDLQLRKRMQIELRRIQQQLGTTFILVTHDQEEALVMSDRIVVMNAGRVEQVGRPQDIYHHPQTRFVAQFVGETSMLGCRVDGRSEDRVNVAFANGALGSFRHYGTASVADGDRGFVSLRPETLGLVEASQGLFQGVVMSVVFTGATTRVTVAVAPGIDLHVSVSDGNVPAIGTTLGVSVSPGAGVYVTD